MQVGTEQYGICSESPSDTARPPGNTSPCCRRWTPVTYCSISVVRDCFGGRRMASVMSLVMMVFMAIHVVAPNIGQLIMLFGSWREISLVTALFSFAVLIWSALRLPELCIPRTGVR